MRLRNLKDGKIAVWAETKADAEKFLKAMEESGVPWLHNSPYSSDDAGPNTEYAYGNHGDGLTMVVGTRGWFAGQNKPNKPYKSITVTEFFKDAKHNEQIVAYYNSDETVTCIHKKDGKVVQSATVKRYHKDADDLRVAAKCALGKMLVTAGTVTTNYALDRMLVEGVPAQKNTATQVGSHSKYKVGDRVRLHREGGDVVTGVIEEAGLLIRWPYGVRIDDSGVRVHVAEDEEVCPAMFRDYIIGLVQEQDPAVSYQPGDKVLVRYDLVDNKTYGGVIFLPDMKGLCGRVVTLKTQLFSGGIWGVNETEAWVTPQMLMGKIVPLDGLEAGDEVLVKEHYDSDFGSVPEQLDLRGTVAMVDRIDHFSGVGNVGIVHAIINGVRYLPEARFVGKLIRIPVEE